MKNKHFYKHISLLLAILMLLPLFAFGTTAEEAEISAAQSAVKAEADALAAKKADLVQGLEAASTIFDYVDKASFVEAGHVERLPEEEELNSYVFRNPDGSKTVYFLAEDVKYVSVTGAVTEKKLELVALDGGYTTRSSNVSLALPTDLSRGITLAHGGATVSLVPNKAGLTESASVATASLFAAMEELESSLVSAPTGIAAGRADYQNAFGVGTTLRYTPTLSGVKEDVILDRYRGKNSFSFTLNTGSLSVFNENGRYFIAESAEAEEKIFIGETWVYDSADHFEKGTLSVTQKSEGVYTLTIGTSVDFLTSPDTVYPVYIDPSLTVSYGEDGEGYIEDVTMFEGVPNINCGTFSYNTVGASSDYIRGRTAVRLPGLYESDIYQNIMSSKIQSVRFCVVEASGTPSVNVSLYPLQSSAWTESGATWNNICEHYTTAVATTKLKNSAVATFDITDLVRTWRENGAGAAGGALDPYQAEQGFIMIAENETTPIKQFCSSEYSIIEARPYVVMDFDSDVEIGTDTTYIKLGDVLSLDVASNPSSFPITWSIDNTSAATIMQGSSSLIASSQTPGKVTVTANATIGGVITPVDTMTVYVVPILSGEYYIETPLSVPAGQCFIEPRGTATSNQLTVNTLDFGNPNENISAEDNRIAVTFVPEGNYGYYTLKHVARARYLGLTGSQIALNATQASSSQKFDIQQCTSGNYKIVTLANSYGYVVSAASDPTTAAGAILTNKAYTQDQSYNDEWIFHRIMPTNDHERVYDPSKWSEFTLRGHSDRLAGDANCYSYALECQYLLYPQTEKVTLDSVGQYANSSEIPVFTELDSVYDYMLNLLSIDAQRGGFQIQPIGKDETCPNGFYKVAMFIESEEVLLQEQDVDFHFYRQNKNGTWSHKLGSYKEGVEGAGIVSLVDVDGHLIFDPESANRSVLSQGGIVGLADYDVFVGYFAVTPINTFVT